MSELLDLASAAVGALSESAAAKRLEHAQTKLQDARAAIRLAQEELALFDSQMLGSDEHRRLVVA